MSRLFICFLLAFALGSCGSENMDTADNSASSEPEEEQSDNSQDTQQNENSDVGSGDCGLTDAEVLITQLINDVRTSGQTCGVLEFAATRPLEINCQLTEAASGHSTDMAENNFFSHTGSDGSSHASRAAAAGYPSTFIGENIAAGLPDAVNTLNLWIGSVGHCVNIMDTAFTQVGVAQAYNANSAYDYYWTLVLAAP